MIVGATRPHGLHREFGGDIVRVQCTCLFYTTINNMCTLLALYSHSMDSTRWVGCDAATADAHCGTTVAATTTGAAGSATWN